MAFKLPLVVSAAGGAEQLQTGDTVSALWQLTPPDDGAFAWINQGGAVKTLTRAGINLSCASAGAHFDLHIRKKAAPATPYTITAAFLFAMDVLADTAFAGILFRESASGKLHDMDFAPAGLGHVYFESLKFTDPTTYTAAYGYTYGPTLFGPLIWFRIADDGVNRICSVSADGEVFTQVFSVGRADFLTADEVGFFIAGFSAAASMTLVSWAEA